MKRKLFIFLMSFCLFTVKINANEQADPRINLLNMANIEISDANMPGHSYGLLVKTKEAIEVNQGNTYTFIVDERYFEWDLTYREFHEWSMNDGAIKGKGQHYVSQAYGNWIYLSFTANKSTLEFTKVTVNNYLYDDVEYPFKMMLFEGDMDDFLGYHTFGSNFSVEEGYLFIDADNPYTKEQVKQMIGATDNKTTTLTTLSSNYLDSSPLGEYYMHFQAKDTEDNLSFFTLNIKVLDVRPPIIEGIDTYYGLTHQTQVDYNAVKEGLIVTDTQDTNLSNEDLILVEDTYKNNENIPGEYILTYQAKDASNNISVYRVNITVTDQQGPVITGPNIVYRDIREGLISEEEVLSMFTAIDAVEGEKEVYLAINNQTIPDGKEELIVQSKDSKNNVSTHRLYVVFVDNTSPIFIKNSLVLTYEAISKMSEADIKNWILQQLNLNTDITILSNEANYTKEGFLYYSYLDEGMTHYGQITFKPTTKSFVPHIVVSSVVVVSGIILFFYFKKKHY